MFEELPLLLDLFLFNLLPSFLPFLAEGYLVAATLFDLLPLADALRHDRGLGSDDESRSASLSYIFAAEAFPTLRLLESRFFPSLPVLLL